jgi:glutathione peroxidase
MNMIRFGGFVAALMTIAGVMTGQEKETGMKEETGIYSFTMKTIDGAEKSLSGYKGSVIMIVNVASKCGYTPQYEGLEKLYQQYKGKGFVILGFPANNFLWQEPGSDEEIKQFCSIKYNVSFDMFSKISVKGSEMHPLYQYLTKESPYSGGVKWNFQKYLIDRRGNVVAKYAPGTDPLEKEVVQKIEELLAQPS